MALTGLYCNTEIINDIQMQMAEIQEILVNAGYVSPDVVTEDVRWSYLPSKIKDLFNTLESNTQKIDNTVDWVNPYSAIFEWQRKNGMIFDHVNRWFLWSGFNFEIINNERQKPRNLTDAFKRNILDINGENIITLEGYFSK